MPRHYPFQYRREHPERFPHFCDTCVPQRRFRLPPHKQRHDRDKHGIPIPVKSTFHEYHSQQSRKRVNLPDSSPSLSSFTADNLNSFILEEIEPDTAYNQRCKAVVNRLCHFMQNNFPDQLRPSEVIKSGSLGKGTAVKGKSDADLVVFLAKLTTISELREILEDILDRMKLYLDKYAGCKWIGTTQYAVQVSVNCHGHIHSVDILPSVDIVRKRTCKDIYAEMETLTKREKKYYSSAFAPLQVDFVSQVPTKVKTLIRLIKYWRKTEFEERTDGKRLPSSYILELIAIGEWGNAGKPQNFDLCKGLYHVFRAIADYKSLRHAWTENYKYNNFVRDQWYVVDPANPFNNVMDACDLWDDVAEKANEFLQSPLIKELPSFDGWMKSPLQ